MTVYMKLCAGVLLAAAGYQDLRTRKISAMLLCFFLTVSTALHIMAGGSYLKSGAAGAVLGLLILLVAKITKESVGYGDGCILCITGLNIGSRENIVLFLAALCLCALFSGFLLVMRRLDRKRAIPFVPFLALGYLIQNVAGGL